MWWTLPSAHHNDTLEMWGFIVGDVVSLLEMWWLIVGDVVAHCFRGGVSLFEMWWLIVGDMVAHC